MCGIAGIFTTGQALPDTTSARLESAASSLAHRGPDGRGIVRVGPFAAAHTRLAIIDLARGDQPMTRPESGLTIVFNGEIYNYLELRTELRARGRSFSTDSDTEVLLVAYEEFGAAALERLNGMFAFAIFDARKHSVVLARDRFGEKPLYYSWNGELLAFASELQAVECLLGTRPALDVDAMGEYLAFGYVAGPTTIARGIKQVPHAEYATFSREGLRIGRYYSLPAESPPVSKAAAPDAGALESALARAVELRLRADVPVAALLSGGVDSSLLTTLARRHTSAELKTFSFGWAGAQDELPFAKALAAELGTDHHEIRLDRGAFVEDIQSVVDAMDMPFADSAAVVVHMLSREIRRNNIKVVISGEGGDELFGGYGWYVGAGSLRDRLRGALKGRGSRHEDYVRGKGAFDADEIRVPALARAAELRIQERVAAFQSLGDDVNGRIRFDYAYFLPWMLMPKIDRMSMASAVEIRAPLLDHELIAQWLPMASSLKIRGARRKVQLESLCTERGLLSREVFHRPKSGMNLPITWWIATNEGVFRDVIAASGAEALEIFGQQRLDSWFAEVKTAGSVGWSRPAQKIWSAFVLELWISRRNERAAELRRTRP